MQWIAAGHTDVGRVRKNNEDAFVLRPEMGLFVVADGMGGHNAGEVASSMACNQVADTLSNFTTLYDAFLATPNLANTELMRKALEEAVRDAGRSIYQRSKNEPACAGMGTTCTVIWLVGRKGFLAHVGDSRVYVLRRNGMFQLSEDHTFIAEQVRRGIMTEEEAKKSQYSNVLTRALGVAETMPIDTLVFDIDPGDKLLLCSDGLHGYFKVQSELASALRDLDPRAGVVRIVDAAKARGGHDNITAIICEISGPADTTDAASRINLLRKIPFFQHLSYQELVKTLATMEVRQLPPGEELIQQGATGDEFYVCLSGELTVMSGEKVIATLPPGAHVGEMALVDRSPRSATVLAHTTVTLLAMSRAHFHDLIRREPAAGSKLLWAFTQVLCARLRATNENLKQAMEELDERTVTEQVRLFPESDLEVVSSEPPPIPQALLDENEDMDGAKKVDDDEL